mmetsp:Transcript_9289/g.14855  ORF Transcript_9289/g.14855 Transcript_9289/m.14855 type:complete len:271 (-) Transcript_9289:208-1020(-)
MKHPSQSYHVTRYSNNTALHPFPFYSHFISFFLPDLLRLLVGTLHPTVRTNVHTKDVIVNDTRPRIVTVQGIVKLRCNPPDHRQLESGNSRKVMMFVVIPNIERHEVQPSVVRIRFLSFHKRIMLRDKVPRHGMQSHSQQRSGNVKHQRLDSKRVHEGDIKCDRRDKVQSRRDAHWLGVDKERTQSVKGGLQNDPDYLFKRRVENPTFRFRGDVHVNDVHTLIVMMFQMILLKGNGGRNALRAIGDHAQNLVVQRLFETEVVGQFVIAER